MAQIYLQVEKSYNLVTAFRATFGSDKGPHVCTISEYDALPEIGHACGHNLIAEVGAAAGIGIRAAIKASGGGLGKVFYNDETRWATAMHCLRILHSSWLKVVLCRYWDHSCCLGTPLEVLTMC